MRDPALPHRALPSLAIARLRDRAHAPRAASSAMLGYDDARHLLARTGFGPTDAEVRAYAGADRAKRPSTSCCARRATAATTPPPASAARHVAAAAAARRDAHRSRAQGVRRRQQVREGLELRAWWVRGDARHAVAAHRADDALLAQPFRVERSRRCGIARLMYRQNATLRANALGNFGDAAARDRQGPGDARLSRQRAEPQGRAERELRARGDGALHARRGPLHRAGREGSRARVHRLEPRPRDRARSCSARGCTTTASRRCSARPGASTATRCSTSCSRARRPREFVDRQAVARIRLARSRSARKSRRIARALPRLGLRHQGRAARAAHVRRVLRAARIAACSSSRRSSSSSARCAQFDLAPEQALPFAIAAAGMGQNLFSPPNVKGWPGGEAWINTTTLLARKQFVDRVTRADDEPMPSR